MSVYSIFFSPTGGTKKIADILLKPFSKYIEIDLSTLNKQDTDFHFKSEDLCFIAVPSFGGRVPEVAIQRLHSLHSHGAKAILVVVYGNRAYEDTLIELFDCLTEENFICTAAVTAIAEHSIMRQFAACRPDYDDISLLGDFAAKIKAACEHDFTPTKVLNLPGNRPYKKRGPIAFKPLTNQNCILCGHCANLCPVNAIPFDSPSTTDTLKCIGCMRCISVCPLQARYLEQDMLEDKIKKTAHVFAERKTCELFM